MPTERYRVETWGGDGNAPAPWWIVRRHDGERICECATLEHAERIAAALSIIWQLEELADAYHREVARRHE